MGYEITLKKAWDAIKGLKGIRRVRFFNDEYEVDPSKKSIASVSSKVEAKDYYKILMLHYIANECRISSIEKDRWISFREFDGGKEYYPASKKRTIDPILKKYGNRPEGILERLTGLNAKKLSEGNASISINVFAKINVGIVIWARDEEFDADCNILFNEASKKIFATEDIAVLGGIVASLV